jgi:hypothetical protein
VSYQTPDGWADTCTIRDDTAEHQIRIMFYGSNHHLAVSCLCRQTGTWNNIGPSLEPLGVFTDLGEAWALYRAHLPADAEEAAS